MKAYSVDLRQKIINTYTNEPISQRQLALRFCVSLSFVQSLLKRYRTDDRIDPRPHGGGQSPKLTPQQLAQLAQLVAQKNDATLEELCDQLYQKTQVRVSRGGDGAERAKAQSNSKKKTLHASEQDSSRVL